MRDGPASPGPHPTSAQDGGRLLRQRPRDGPAWTCHTRPWDPRRPRVPSAWDLHRPRTLVQPREPCRLGLCPAAGPPLSPETPAGSADPHPNGNLAQLGTPAGPRTPATWDFLQAQPGRSAPGLPSSSWTPTGPGPSSGRGTLPAADLVQTPDPTGAGPSPAPDPVQPRDPRPLPGPTPALALSPTPDPCRSRTRSVRPRRLTSGHRLGGTRSGPNETEPSTWRSRGRRNNGALGRGRLRRSLSPTPARDRTRAPAPCREAAGARLRPGWSTAQAHTSRPAPLRPAPGGAQNSGPAPRPMGRESRAGGGAGETKVGAGPRRGGAAGPRDCGTAGPRGCGTAGRHSPWPNSRPVWGGPSVLSTRNRLIRQCSPQTSNSGV
uniref:Uncharacterized protein n=1 Tax=Neovison vison TaxID=452646 RepID=A0A8C7AI98_NEOVI